MASADLDHAVIVGISEYPQLTPLAGPVRDAKEFKTWLTSSDGGRVPPEQAKLIVSRPRRDRLNAHPSLSSVQAELDRLQQLGIENDLRAGRRLWLYFAGHGVAPNPRDAALLMANADPNRLYHLPAGPYVDWFRAAAFFDEVVVLMDCCRDHDGRLPPFAFPWTDMAAQGAEVHYLLAFATKWSRKAREKPIGPRGAVRGVFTCALLEGLKHGQTTASTLEAFVKRRLPELIGKDEYQEPHFDFDFNIALAETAVVKPCKLTISVSQQDASVTVRLVDGQFTELASFAMEGGPHEVGVDPGLYALRRSDQPDEQQVLVSVTESSQHVEL